NSKLNNLQNCITAKENNLLKEIDLKSDLIVSNILAEILVDLIDDAYGSLKTGGYLILSGIIEQKESLIRERLEASGFSIEERNNMNHWVSLIAQKKESHDE